MMNPEIKKAWIAKLAVLKQGRGRLRDGDAFCCLGALCYLHAEMTGDHGWDGDTYAECANFPPVSVYDWAGLTLYDASVTIDGETAPLFVHNDGDAKRGIRPKTFGEIAKAIDEQL